MVAVDTGGTFTDLLLLRAGAITALKVPSTPSDPSRAVLDGLRTLLGEEVRGARIIVGTTVATNALLERSGARVALITNRGFEDVIEIGRQNRPQLYALSGSRPPPLVDRSWRIGIAGRMDETGRELVPVDRDELRSLVERVDGAEAVAVVLLHAYANARHERAVAAALEATGLPVSLSSDILPEFREYERTSTTVTNAYVGPRVRRYLSRIEAGTGSGSIRIMGSSGGALPVRQAVAEPVHTVLSGPAGGVVGALDWARRSGVTRVLSLDMGGTSTDVSLVPGAPVQTREGRVGEVPIAVPLMDIHTVGAGGGSLVRLDPGGGLRVGPESAGADPGPVCYGRGGKAITVTDANLFLGRLPASGLLGGASPLDRAAVEAPMRTLAARAGLSPEELAEGIVDVANTAMERALRVISVERGVDPSDFHLVAFGGAAGLHAAELAERIGVAGAFIPPNPGLLSAFGMLVAPVVRDRSRTVLGLSPEAIDAVLDHLEVDAREEMLADGASVDALETGRWVDARYRGQSFELRVSAAGWEAAFHEAHEARYGYRRDWPVEAVSARVRVEAPGEPVTLAAPEVCVGPAETIPVVHRGRRIASALLTRLSLEPDVPVPGPAVVVEYSSTTWCPPGWQVMRDIRGALRLRRVEEAVRLG